MGSQIVNLPGPANAILVSGGQQRDPITNAATDGQLYIGKADGTMALATLTQGSNVTITNGDGTITIAAGGGSAFTLAQTLAAGNTSGANAVVLQGGMTNGSDPLVVGDVQSSTPLTGPAIDMALATTFRQTATIIASTNASSDGLKIYAQNLTQNIAIGWNEIVTTGNYSIIPAGTGLGTLNVGGFLTVDQRTILYGATDDTSTPLQIAANGGVSLRTDGGMLVDPGFFILGSGGGGSSEFFYGSGALLGLYGWAFGGEDIRGVLTVQDNCTGLYAANTDPGDAGRFFVNENTSRANTAGQYSNITLQVNPTGSLPGGRVLGDIRLVRSSANSTDAFFVFSAFTQSNGYRDFATFSETDTILGGNLSAAGTVTAGVFKCGTSGNVAYLGNSALDLTATANQSLVVSVAGTVTVNAPTGQAGRLAIANSTIANWNATGFNALLPIGLASYTVALLPAGTAGQIAFASDGCNPGEGTGTGTGTTVQYNSGVAAWCIMGTNTPVTA